MFGPPARFCRILISRLIFFFLTGFRTLMMHFSSLTMLMPSKTWRGVLGLVAQINAKVAAPCTSEYFPRPTFLTIS